MTLEDWRKLAQWFMRAHIRTRCIVADMGYADAVLPAALLGTKMQEEIEEALSVMNALIMPPESTH